MSKDILDQINKLMRKLTDSDLLFGGKIMVLCGDFRQTLPVIEGVNSEIVITGNSLLKSPLFIDNFKRMCLTRNMRAIREGKDFKNWLLSIGTGLSSSKLGEGYIEIPQEYFSKDVVKEIYGERINPFSGDLEGKVVLSCRNKVVNLLNERILNLL